MIDELHQDHVHNAGKSRPLDLVKDEFKIAERGVMRWSPQCPEEGCRARREAYKETERTRCGSLVSQMKTHRDAMLVPQVIQPLGCYAK